MSPVAWVLKLTETMFDFIIRETFIKGTQRFIDGLKPKVSVYVPAEIPLPSIGILKIPDSRKPGPRPWPAMPRAG